MDSILANHGQAGSGGKVLLDELGLISVVFSICIFRCHALSIPLRRTL